MSKLFFRYLSHIRGRLVGRQSGVDALSASAFCTFSATFPRCGRCILSPPSGDPCPQKTAVRMLRAKVLLLQRQEEMPRGADRLAIYYTESVGHLARGASVLGDCATLSLIAAWKGRSALLRADSFCPLLRS